MDFPKAPKRDVKGNVTLIVRPPVSSDGATEESKDPVNNLDIRVPDGFSMGEIEGDLLDANRKKIFEQFSNLRTRSRRCKPCRQKASAEALNQAEELAAYIIQILEDHNARSTTVRLGQDSRGTPELTVQSFTRRLKFQVFPKVVMTFGYEGSKLVRKESYSLSTGRTDSELRWVMAGEGMNL